MLFLFLCSLGRQTRTVEQEGTKLQFWDYSTILTKLGHSREAVTLLKVDIEGYEFDTLSGGCAQHVMRVTVLLEQGCWLARIIASCHCMVAGWLEQEACSFPQQIAMEVHFSVGGIQDWVTCHMGRATLW